MFRRHPWRHHESPWRWHFCHHHRPDVGNLVEEAFISAHVCHGWAAMSSSHHDWQEAESARWEETRDKIPPRTFPQWPSPSSWLLPFRVSTDFQNDAVTWDKAHKLWDMEGGHYIFKGEILLNTFSSMKFGGTSKKEFGDVGLHSGLRLGSVSKENPEGESMFLLKKEIRCSA